MESQFDTKLHSRRRVLQLVLGSPLFAMPAVSNALLDHCLLQPGNEAFCDELNRVITRAEDAISVFDFERAAARVIPPAHYGFLKSGAGDDSTVRENRKGLQRIKLRLRRLRGIGQEGVAQVLRMLRAEFELAMKQAGTSTLAEINSDFIQDRYRREFLSQ